MNYDDIKNPLTDDVVKDIIINYSKKGNMYYTLTKRFNDIKKHKEHYIPAQRDALYEFIYNEWRNAILKPNSIRLSTIKKEDLGLLQSLLISKPSIKTEQEYISFIYSNPVLERYAWSNHGNNTDWIHINSNNIQTGQNKNWQSEHRLYINTDGVEDFVVYMFVKECINKNLPYYVKYSPNTPRDDMIVIYSNTDNLDDYIEIVKKIFKDNPWLDKYMFEPPILTGKINEYVGYASDPSDKKESFHQRRAKIIENSINDNMWEWYLNHMNVFDVVLKQVLSNKYDNLVIAENDLLNQMKFYFVNYDINGEIPNLFNLSVYGKNDSIGKDAFLNNMRKHLASIVKNDPLFLQSVKNSILKNAIKLGVDDNFCFDKDRKEKLVLNSSLHI